MDEKMKLAFQAWLDVERPGASVKEVVEWTMDYLRTQQEAIGIVYKTTHPSPDSHGKYFSWLKNPRDVPAETELFARPVPAYQSVTEELAAAFADNSRAFQHIPTGEVRYSLNETHKEADWRDVMIIPNLSNETIDAVIAAAT